jgi:hypothetical protein
MWIPESIPAGTVRRVLMDWILDLLKSAFGAGIVAGLFGLAQWRLNRKAQKEDKAAERNISSCSQRGEEIKTLQKTVNALIVADRTILYDRIKHLAKVYIKRDWISVEEYEDLKRMHKVYHDDLEGNGFLDSIMAEVDNLEKRVL